MIKIPKTISEYSVKKSCGHKWSQNGIVLFLYESIAVYIYILYYIILCDHVTVVTTKTVYTRGKIFFSYIRIYFPGSQWSHGHKMPPDSVLPLKRCGHNLVTTGHWSGHND